MAAARPPGVSQAGAVTAPEPGPHRSSVNRRASVNRHASARLAATDRPGPARVRATTSAADWPGGGTIVRTTGKVFFTMESQDYVCSAAVVTSANTDVVITAAHCVQSGAGQWATNWTFVPAYANGGRPYGTWTASHYFVARQWSKTGDEDDDIAFVTLNPQQANGRNAYIGQIVGGLNIAFGTGPAREYAFGYPAEPPYDGASLYYCSGQTTADPYRASGDTGLRCDLTAGSSGGPWLSGFDPASGTGTITSVSSFKYDTDQVTLYGPRLGPVAKALFDRAEYS